MNKRLYDLYCVMCYFLPQNAFGGRVPDPMGSFFLQRSNRPLAGLKKTDKEGTGGNKWEGQGERGEVEGPLAMCLVKELERNPISAKSAATISALSKCCAHQVLLQHLQVLSLFEHFKVLIKCCLQHLIFFSVLRGGFTLLRRGVTQLDEAIMGCNVVCPWPVYLVGISLKLLKTMFLENSVTGNN